MRSSSAFAGSLLLFSLALASSGLANDPKVEGEAKKLQGEAMDVDFLGLELKKAKTKLQSAIKKCGKDKCSKPLLASLHRDLGIVAINNGDSTEGEGEFAEAFAADPAVEIAKDYLANGDVKKAWEAAKKKKGGTGGTTTTTTGGNDDPTPTGDADGALTVKTKVAPAGSELPLWVEIPKGLDGVVSVKVQFKGEGMEKYKPIDAKKTGGKWLAIIPCDGTLKAGSLKFFVKAYDEASAEVEHYGTIKKPATIKLVTTMPDDAEQPVLPGDKEPALCGADGSAGKPEGSGCHDDDECEKGLVCMENAETGKKWCKPGERPKETSAGNSPKVWLGIEGQLDIVFLGAERDICKQTTWTCSWDGPDGRKDIGNTPGITLLSSSDGSLKSGGQTNGGTALATKRVFVSLDYFVVPRLSLGLRLGYAFGGNPTEQAKFLPFHGEVRMQYFITESTFRPYFILGGGIAQFDAPVPNAIVRPNDASTPGATCMDNSNPQPSTTGGPSPVCSDGGPVVLKGVTAYKLAGIGFLSAGIGTWIMVGNKFSVNLAMKMVFPLPTFNFTLAPEIGLRFGL